MVEPVDALHRQRGFGALEGEVVAFGGGAGVGQHAPDLLRAQSHDVQPRQFVAGVGGPSDAAIHDVPFELGGAAAGHGVRHAALRAADLANVREAVPGDGARAAVVEVQTPAAAILPALQLGAVGRYRRGAHTHQQLDLGLLRGGRGLPRTDQAAGALVYALGVLHHQFGRHLLAFHRGRQHHMGDVRVAGQHALGRVYPVADRHLEAAA